MSLPSFDLDLLLRRRRTIHRELASLGDLRPGSLKSRHRRCGKSSCRCAREGDPGHGPSWFLSRLIKGKMHCRAIPVVALEETRRQVAECQRLRGLTRELMEVSDKICETRLAAGKSVPAGEKGASKPRSRRRSPPRPSG